MPAQKAAGQALTLTVSDFLSIIATPITALAAAEVQTRQSGQSSFSRLPPFFSRFRHYPSSLLPPHL
eukprot:745622-Hanusia_phi.AAC.4